MMTVTINTATGTPPFNIWVANNCNANSPSIFIDTIQSVPYTFTLPPSYQDLPFVVKLTDDDNCEVCETFGFGPTPTPTVTATPTAFHFINTSTPLNPTDSVNPLSIVFHEKLKKEVLVFRSRCTCATRTSWFFLGLEFFMLIWTKIAKKNVLTSWVRRIG